MKGNESENVLNKVNNFKIILIQIDKKKNYLNKKLSNRQIKLKVLVDEAIVAKNETKPNQVKDKRLKCGQCEKKVAFTVIFIN